MSQLLEGGEGVYWNCTEQCCHRRSDKYEIKQWIWVLTLRKTTRWDTAEDEVKAGWWRSSVETGFSGLQRARSQNRFGCLLAQNVHVGYNEATMSTVMRSDNWDLFWGNRILLIAYSSANCAQAGAAVCVGHLLFFRLNDALGQPTDHKNRAVSCIYHTLVYIHVVRAQHPFHINLLPTKGNFPAALPGGCWALWKSRCLQEKSSGHAKTHAQLNSSPFMGICFLHVLSKPALTKLHD